MDRIILEVDDQVAGEYPDFIQFVKEVQDKAAERGLTEDILNDILNQQD